MNIRLKSQKADLADFKNLALNYLIDSVELYEIITKIFVFLI